jgi:multisubunit Na+/H+ antiporter MnhG subunit
MVNQPHRQRRSGPLGKEAVPGSQASASEWRVRLALALLAVSACSVLGNVAAVFALGGAMAHLGAPQGPLEFALVFVGGVVGLGGDALILTGSLAVLRPDSRISGQPSWVTWGLGLQLLAAALVGVLESSWLFGLLYVLLLAGLAALWIRTSAPEAPRPAARHAVPEPSEPPIPAAPARAPARQPIPWVGTAPPPPSAAQGREADPTTPTPDQGSWPDSGRGMGR